MSDNLNLGHLITDANAQRDAIHVAVAPVTASELLRPGQHVGLDEQGQAEISESSRCVGIVDPFLKEALVEPGQRFWLFLYPGSVVSLRHHWTHPAFADESPKMSDDRAYSERWLYEYASRISPYDIPKVAFANLIDGLKTGELFAHGTDLHRLCELDDADELKRHAERYLGIRIDWSGFRFSCSC